MSRAPVVSLRGRGGRFLLLLLLAALAPPAPLPAQETPGVRQTAQGVVFDFQDADLRLVLGALAEAGGLNIVYGELPARRVTLRTTEPVQVGAIPALLRSLADANGLTLTQEGSFLRVTAPPAAPAPGAGAPTGVLSQAAMQLFVYRLKHARADRIAGTLQAVFGGEPASAGPADTRTPSLSDQLRGQRLPPGIPEPAAPAPQAAGPAAVLQAQLAGGVQIVPDETTNSLLVRASPQDWEVVQQAIQALDLRPLQVLIEGLILEVRRSDRLDVGVSAQGTSRRVAGDTELGGSFNTLGTGELIVRLSRLAGIDLEVALSALSASGRVRIHSRPVLFAQNNLEARILIGAERPFIQVFRALPTDAAVRDQVVQYREVGTSLTVRPTINLDGYVNLQVLQEVSNATAETQFGAPVISTREATTQVFARDGQTVVIGGLIEQMRDRSRSGVPGLKDIPVVGWLFGQTRIENVETELFIFLTPHLVTTDADADRVLEQIRGASREPRERALPREPLIAPVQPAPSPE
jgi:general secretion pathway protein D